MESRHFLVLHNTVHTGLKAFSRLKGIDGKNNVVSNR